MTDAVRSPGLHHITAVCGDAQRNLDFYAGVLGLRFVKKTINFDDPGTYHLYYGDYAGNPGTILTFFPFAGVPRGRSGAGAPEATGFLVPPDSLDAWAHRLEQAGVRIGGRLERFGEQVLSFEDPDGLPLELVASGQANEVDPWVDGPVPTELAIRGFAGVTLVVQDAEKTLAVVKHVFGLSDEAGSEEHRTRLMAPDASVGAYVDVIERPVPGRPGAGTVHHVALRARDAEEQAAMAERVREIGLYPTPVRDRQYFESVYFREAGGILLEIATDAPGFAIDEDIDSLGMDLKLPPWLEERRDVIQQRLPELTLPTMPSN